MNPSTANSLSFKAMAVTDALGKKISIVVLQQMKMGRLYLFQSYVLIFRSVYIGNMIQLIVTVIIKMSSIIIVNMPIIVCDSVYTNVSSHASLATSNVYLSYSAGCQTHLHPHLIASYRSRRERCGTWRYNGGWLTGETCSSPLSSTVAASIMNDCVSAGFDAQLDLYLAYTLLQRRSWK